MEEQVNNLINKEDELSIVEEISDTPAPEKQLPTTMAPTTMAPTSETKLSNITESNKFTSIVDEAKIGVVRDAAADKEGKFVKDFEGKIKDATLKLAELEKNKAELEQQNIKYHQELLETQQELNEHKQAENKWANKEKRRQYHFNGVKPIMGFVGITEPMNLFILYLLTTFLLPFYLLQKFFRGTIGALISGAEDENRPKQVRGFLWTMLGIIFLGVVALVVFLILRWLGIVSR